MKEDYDKTLSQCRGRYTGPQDTTQCGSPGQSDWRRCPGRRPPVNTLGRGQQPGGTAIWFPQPTPHLIKEPQGWGLSFTGAFGTGMELKKLLSSGPSHFFEYPSTQSFLQGPFEESRLLSYIWPVAATNLQTDLWILSSPKASFSPSTKTNK